jgi:hypothetical protein
MVHIEAFGNLKWSAFRSIDFANVWFYKLTSNLGTMKRPIRILEPLGEKRTYARLGIPTPCALLYFYQNSHHPISSFSMIKNFYWKRNINRDN